MFRHPSIAISGLTACCVAAFLAFALSAPLAAAQSQEAVYAETERLFNAVNQACGFEAGQTPNNGPECMKARQEMEAYQKAHARELNAITTDKVVQELDRIQSQYGVNCRDASASDEDCRHYRAILQQNNRLP